MSDGDNCVAMYADLVIVGGGLVGASLAAAICSNPSTESLSVLLIDPSPPDDGTLLKWPSVSIRTSTINPSSQEFLSDIGIWYHIPQSRIAPVDSMLVWDCPQTLPFQVSTLHQRQESNNAQPGVMYFQASDIDHDVLAYVIDNNTLRHAAFLALKNVIEQGKRDFKVLRSSVSAIRFQDSGSHHLEADDCVPWPEIELSDGTRIHARLIAACDGSRSRVRALAGGDWFSLSYDQRAVVANLRVSDASFMALQRFVDTGPVALLPVASGDDSLQGGPLANVVWTTTDAEAKALVDIDDVVFLNELNLVLSAHEYDTGSNERPPDTPPSHKDPLTDIVDSFSRATVRWINQSSLSTTNKFPRIPTCMSVVGKRMSFPLSAGHAPKYVLSDRRVVLVGDAAHCVHPLAGQGVNLGFADARAVSECIGSAASCGRDIGGEHGAPLRRYESDRISANILAVSGLHALRAAFSLTGSARSVRRLGLTAVESFSPLKKAILRLMR